MTSEVCDKDSVYNVRNFLKSNVPRDNFSNIEAELKKDFVFAKKKSRQSKNRNKKKKNHHLNRIEKKRLGFFNLPRNSLKYNDMLPIHHIWIEYMYKVLELNKQVPNVESKAWDSFTQSVYRTDFHGSILKIVRSKCQSYVDKMGICVLDTKNTFKILSEDNVVTTIPKKDCVFEMQIKDFKLKLFGKQLCVKPAERSTKKVKAQQHPDL